MEEDLARAHPRAFRLDRTYGVALFDIDHFKLYNDNYGHLAGDDALREVAHCLDGGVRAGETVYRYGGEEFLLLLPECNIDEVVMATVRICQAVSSAALPHEARPTAPHFVTLSAGVSCREEGSSLTAPDLLRRADKALYQAKSAGRNRVHVAPSNQYS
jgi:diguanylate cyclase (GGDEF)-like protein